METARKHNRIVQHGTQGRSIHRWAQVAEIARSGKLGKLLISRALCYKPRGSIGIKPNTQAPAELDYNLWLGPAKLHPFNENYVTTTGTGSGISATATSATRASTRWTSRAG